MTNKLQEVIIDSCLVWVSCSILTILNVAYLLKLMRVEDKRFHIMMFLIMQMSYLTYIAAWSLWYESNFHEKKPISYVLNNNSWFFLLTAHSIFVIKYYIVSLKISEVMN